MLAVTQSFAPCASSPSLAPVALRSVAFSTATIRTGRVVVAKIDCTGLSPDDIACVPTSLGYEVEVLPASTRQGDHVIIGLRIHRRLGTPHSLCSIRFMAGSESALASVTVLN